MKPRSKARELTVQVLFQDEFTESTDFELSLNTYNESFTGDQEAMEYARVLLHGIKTNLKSIDAIIESTSAHWKLSRMALIDKNILRMGVFELKYMSEEIPVQVAINEAIEIAKKFGSSDSKSFINGILDNIAKSV